MDRRQLRCLTFRHSPSYICLAVVTVASPVTGPGRLRGGGRQEGGIAEGERNTVERAEALLPPKGAFSQ